MKKIIFWFSSFRRLNYWFEYTRKNFGEGINVGYLKEYDKRKYTITIYDILKIEFRTDIDRWSHVGISDTINQYWVEDLFDNNFEEFFFQILKDNLEDIKEDKLYKAECMCVPIELEEETNGKKTRRK